MIYLKRDQFSISVDNLAELQKDVNKWLSEYNNLRSHSGKYCYGKTPMQTFMDSKKMAVEKKLDNLYNQDAQKLQTDKFDTVKKECAPDYFSDTKNKFVGIAPSEAFDEGMNQQGAKLVSAQNGIELSGNNL